MIHVAEKHRVLAVPAIPAVLAQFPSAKVVDFHGQSALIPHTFRDTRLLRAMGFEVPAPVLYHYDWPHPPGQPPFEAQRKTVAMLTTNQRGYVLNDKGTGKTRCGLWAFDYLKKAGLAKKLLVVAPLSTLHFTWGRSVFEMVPHLSHVVVHGDKKKRQKLLAQDHDIYIINHHGLTVVLDELVARTDIDCVLIDELTAFRTFNTTLNKAARKLVAGKPFAWGMTGSPTPESPVDAYGQCMVLTPDTVPRRFSHFRDMTMTKITQFKYVARPDAKDTVLRAMQPAVRFTLEDVTELPDVVVQPVKIGMGKKQTETYEALRKEACAQVGTGEITAANAGAVLNKMLQVSIGYVYAKEEGATERHVIALDNEERLERLIQDIGESSRKVIVFAPFTHALRGISEHLTKNKIEHASVDGSTPSAERDKVFGLFQNTDKFKAIVAHPKCMSHGVTLTAADTIIWFGPIDSHETFDQANARIRRVSQRFKQLVLLYQGSKAEETSYKRLNNKQTMQDGVLALFAQNQV
ncbi:DEAD/DEAH box helicase [Methylobacterium sp. 092160098-2]|uniref:SNF2-related protein n=1 Tax=Methylobacterium sp. 092160098-2 TaxID=3025129 RepID=UPI002381B943|nr:DEAD/DEAH box helicase [Methylobacterium sp. 092160098-2]MDE4913482.1 DEAD/DEAH box helicase [Methylobacterium sp. 092160098-2]